MILPMAVSFQCMTKFTTNKNKNKLKKLKNKDLKKKKKNDSRKWNWSLFPPQIALRSLIPFQTIFHREISVDQNSQGKGNADILENI